MQWVDELLDLSGDFAILVLGITKLVRVDGCCCIKIGTANGLPMARSLLIPRGLGIAQSSNSTQSPHYNGWLSVIVWY